MKNAMLSLFLKNLNEVVIITIFRVSRSPPPFPTHTHVILNRISHIVADEFFTSNLSYFDR